MSFALLVVEDDRPTHKLLATIGQRCGMEVVSAFDGDGAIATVGDRRFAAVILDLLLPGRNGFEVLRHIQRRDPELLGRTIVITAATLSTSIDCPELSLTRAFLRKPLDVTELMDELQRCANECSEA